MQKKTIIHLLLMCLLLIVLPMNALAAQATIQVKVNGKSLQLDAAPFIENGRTLVPLRGIFEAIDAQVSWDSYSKTITASRADISIRIQLGNTKAMKNGKEIKLETAAKAVNGRTFVPLRFIGESFGAQVLWDSGSKTISIVDQKPATSTSGKLLTIQQVAEKRNEVVLIKIYDKRNEEIGTGSGVIASADGKVITNYHVIDGATTIEAYTSDKKKYLVSGVYSYDVARDLAVLQLSNASKLPAAKLGDSSKMKIGDNVVAIGSPLGLQDTVTNGIISSNRKIDGYEFLQTSAPISPGSSGGALYNMYGEVIGITSAGFIEGQNLNLAIPINEVKAHLKSTTLTSVKDMIKQVYTAFSYDKYAEFLLEYFNHFPIPLDSPRYDLSLHSTYVQEAKDNSKVLEIYLTIPVAEYADFARAMKQGHELDVTTWLYDVLLDAELRYSDKQIYVILDVEGKFNQDMLNFFGSDVITHSDGTHSAYLGHFGHGDNNKLSYNWYYEWN